jgi:hypothetical protein
MRGVSLCTNPGLAIVSPLSNVAQSLMPKSTLEGVTAQPDELRTIGAWT